MGSESDADDGLGRWRGRSSCVIGFTGTPTDGGGPMSGKAKSMAMEVLAGAGGGAVFEGACRCGACCYGIERDV